MQQAQNRAKTGLTALAPLAAFIQPRSTDGGNLERMRFVGLNNRRFEFDALTDQGRQR
jgi:hypothetical protein